MRVARDKEGYLLVQVEYRLGCYQKQDWAVLDTGFSGIFCLPSNMLNMLRAKVGGPDGEELVELANSSRVGVPYYIGSVKVAGADQETFGHIYLLGDKPIVGLKALQGLIIMVTAEPKIFPLMQLLTLEMLLKTLDP